MTLPLYLQPRQLVILALGFFSGLPLALSASTLTAWLSDAKVDRTAIGIFAAIGTPYALKFLWSPMMDGIALPMLNKLGRRRSWLLFIQTLLAASIGIMAFADPAIDPAMTALVAVAVATLSASQDTVIDAYRVEILPKEEQGFGAAQATFGYRMGMLVSGAGALALAQLYGWHFTYTAMAGLASLAIPLTFIMHEPKVAKKDLPKAFAFGTFLKESVIAPFADFMTRPHWLAVILFVILYKLGDALIGSLFNPFLLDIGFTKIQIAEIVKLYGLAATILGSFLGGWLVVRLGAMRTMMLGGIVHSATNLLLIPLAGRGADVHFLILTIVFINLTGGAGIAAFVAYLSQLTKAHYTATQYALLSALSAVGRTLLSTPSGWLAMTFGWQIFFIIATVTGVPGLLILWWLETRPTKSPK